MSKTSCRALIFGASLVPSPVPGADCAHEAERQAAVDTAGARSVRIEAGAGNLRVEGRDGFARVEAHGTACASDPAILEKIRIRARREGDVVVVKAEMPELMSWGWNQRAQLDLVVALPRNLAVRVEDGGGSAEISHVGALTVEDGSGDLWIRDVAGDLVVDDGSGSIEITGVTGDVRVSDGSGSIEVNDVGGSVTVVEDGSGSIAVSGVKGDFTVASDGSGGIAHRQVAGQVRIPGRRNR